MYTREATLELGIGFNNLSELGVVYVHTEKGQPIAIILQRSEIIKIFEIKEKDEK